MLFNFDGDFDSDFDSDKEGSGVPGFDRMMQPILKALLELGGEAQLKKLDAKVVEIMKLPKEAASILRKGTKQTLLSYRMAWARTYLKKYGLLKNTVHPVKAYF